MFLVSISRGTLIGKIKTRIEVNKYLSNIYDDNVAIDEIKYVAWDPFKKGDSIYSANCYDKNNSNINFIVYSIKGTLMDDYAENKWSYEITKELDEMILEEKISTIARINLTDTLYLKYKQYGYNIPDVFSQQNELEDVTTIHIKLEYNHKNFQEDGKIIFKILTILREKIKFKIVYFEYKDKNYSFNNDIAYKLNNLEDVYEHLN